LKEHLGIGFGETSADGRFTLLPNVCLGACDHAPVIMIDEDLHGNVDPEMLDRILSHYE
jgi:NADH-quinone oxidoreductase subunit E